MRNRVAGPGQRVRRRDRRGRGMRGPLAPPAVPVARSRAEHFDDLVRDEARRLEQRWSHELSGVEFAVEDVPPVSYVSAAEPWPDEPVVPLGQALPGNGRRPARIVVYRRPIEARGGDDDRNLARLIRDVVVEEVADLLGLPPESVDPSYDSPDE